MNCCTNCFNDKEIIGFIISNSTENGNCEFCQSAGVQVIDPRELQELFEPVVSLFKTVDEMKLVVPEEKLLREKLQESWNIFKLPQASHQTLLSAILLDLIQVGNPLLNEPVEIEILYKDILEGEVHEKKWESFADEIKFQNRFFLKQTIDLDLLAELLKNLSKTYDRGKIFYRARVSDLAGIEIEKMGKPPADIATPGRANPKGIPYLYLSTKAETTIYESRSSYLDYITIAEFKLIEPMEVVSLRQVATVSPFAFGDQLSKYIVHQKYLARLEQELSKPIRRHDKELDYLPSQYLCEYVKSLGYDAIEYGSAMYSGGINLAIFNDDKLEAKSTQVYEITEVDLTHQKVL